MIDWSHKKAHQQSIDQEMNTILTSIEINLRQCSINEERRKEAKRLLIEHKEKQQQELVFEYDKHLFSTNEWDIHINPRTDDEREPFVSPLQNQKQKIHREVHSNNIQQYIHIHDTASGSDDAMITNEENNKNRLCQDGNLSSFIYLSKLKNKLIKCNES